LIAAPCAATHTFPPDWRYTNLVHEKVVSWKESLSGDRPCLRFVYVFGIDYSIYYVVGDEMLIPVTKKAGITHA
jgi:hypothetical protein